MLIIGRRIAPTAVPVVRPEVGLLRLQSRQFAPHRRLRFNRYNAVPAVVRIRLALARVRDSRTTDKPIAQVSRTLQKIAVKLLVQISQMDQRIARLSQMGQIIAVQLRVRVNQAMGPTIVPASRIMLRTIDPVSRTTTGTFLVREALATTTPVVVRTTTLLDPVLLIIGRLLRKLATLRWTMVVRDSRFHVRRLPISNRSSSLGSTQAHGRRTIVRKNRHKRGPRITALRKTPR